MVVQENEANYFSLLPAITASPNLT